MKAEWESKGPRIPYITRTPDRSNMNPVYRSRILLINNFSAELQFINIVTNIYEPLNKRI